MAVLESQVEEYLKSTVAELGGMTYKLSVPGVRGYPDRLVKLPDVSAFVVELKRPKGGRLSALQVVRHREMRDVGWRVYVAKNREEIDDVIRREIAEALGYVELKLPGKHRFVRGLTRKARAAVERKRRALEV